MIALLLWTQVLVGEAPARVALRAHYVDGAGAAHALSLWRDGARLRRDTDGTLQLFVEHAPDGNDRYHVVDRARGRVFHVRRANLYRLGSFPDWQALSTLLPRAPADEPVKACARARTPAGVCRWYEARTRRICWSAAWRLPLVVEERRDGAFREVLRVDQVASPPLAPDLLRPPVDGLTQVEVDDDLGGGE